MDRRVDGNGPAMKSGRRRGATTALLAFPVLFLGLFFVVPVVTIIATGVAPAGQFELGAIGRVLTDESVRSVAWFTLWQAVASTALTLVLALPGAYVMSRLSFRGRRTLHAVLMVPFVLPTVVVGSAFLAFLGPQSPVNSISTWLFGDGAFTVDLRRTVTAILIAHVFFNYAVVVRTVGGLWSMIDPKMEDAARVLGASRWRAFT